MSFIGAGDCFAVYSGDMKMPGLTKLPARGAGLSESIPELLVWRLLAGAGNAAYLGGAADHARAESSYAAPQIVGWA